MRKNKVLGCLLIFSLPIVLSLYAISSFVITNLGQSQMPADLVAIGELQPASNTETLLNILHVVLGLLGVLAIFVGIPLGIYLLVKKDQNSIAELQQKEQYKMLSLEQIEYISKWSWGAFFGGFIWALGNRLYLWAIGALIPFVNIYFIIKLCMDGRKMSWERGTWANFDEYKKRQKTVMWVIIGVIIAGTIIDILYFLSGAASY